MQHSTLRPRAILDIQHSSSPPSKDVRVSLAVALVLALSVFCLLTGAQFSMLTGDGWIGHTDLGGSYGGSLVFQADAWRLPPGANPLFGHTSIVYSDSLPLAALIAKLIAGVTGKPIMYIGAWFALNIFATALVALYLGRQLALTRIAQVALAVLLTANVISLARMIGAQHLALSSTWLLLLAFLLVLKRASSLAWCVLLLLAAGVHAYLLAMCLVIYGCQVIGRRVGGWQAMVVLSILAGWMFLLGYAYPTLSSLADNEFKPFGADLAFFFNSFNWGIIPEIFKPAREPQFDALLFVGSGSCLLIGACAMALFARKISWLAAKPLAPLLLPVILMLVVATGLSVQIFGHTLLDLPLASPWDKLFRTFRAIGRFGWAASYLLIIASVCLIASWRSPWAVGLLCVASAMQLADVANAHHYTLIQPYSRLAQQPSLSDLDTYVKQHAGQWNRQVYKLANGQELESLQLDDGLLAQYGARFAITHSARQSAAEVQQANDATLAALAQNQPGLYIISPTLRERVSVNLKGALQSQGFLFYFTP